MKDRLDALDEADTIWYYSFSGIVFFIFMIIISSYILLDLRVAIHHPRLFYPKHWLLRFCGYHEMSYMKVRSDNNIPHIEGYELIFAVGLPRVLAKHYRPD